MKHLSAAILISMLLGGLHGQASPTDFPGMIGEKNEAQQAVDILDQNGQAILPEALTQKLKQGVDISLLDPAPSDLWSHRPVARLNSSSYTLGLPSNAEVEMASNVPSMVGEYRFTVYSRSGGGNQQFQVLMGKKAHNVLLRKALLEKLGYQIQPVQWMPRLRVRFNGHATLLGFLTDIQNNTEGSADRWITNNTKDDSVDYADLQDVVVFPANAIYYSLEAGVVPPSVIQDRRILNSLLVPFALTDVPESVNSFNWTGGRVVNQSVYLSYEWSQWFNPSFQDAQWIMRNIAKLSAQDWQEVAAAAQLPPAVALLTAEKLKSRRNDLNRLFKIKAGNLPVNPQITYGSQLVGGKVTEQNWTGYASRFSFGDPDNPLSSPEITAFLKSKAIGSLMQSAMSFINGYFNNNKQVQQKVSDHVLGKMADQLVSEVKTGQTKSIPMGMYAIPSLSGNIILSREVVVGSYMGTDNLVQMADSVGFQITPGVFVGIDGLKNISESANIGLQIQRSYTHIKPLKSIKAALKTPYKNMIVPMLQRKWVSDLNSLPTESGKIDLNALAASLDKDMGVGESLIISDSIGAVAGLSLVYPTSPSVSFQTAFNASQLYLHRVQIYKLDKYTFQVYDDPGPVRRGSVAFGMNVYGVPVLSLQVSSIAGKVKTKFYTLRIGSDNADELEKKRSQYESSVHVLRQIFNDNSLETLASQQKPYVIGHDFEESDVNLGFLFFQYRKAALEDRFLFHAPTGEKKAVLYRSTGYRAGKDYATLAEQTLTSFLQRHLKSDSLILDTTSSGNPGDTFYGSSVSRQVIYEGVQRDPNKRNSGLLEASDSEYAQINHLNKGWNISKEKAQEILREMNRNFGYQIMNPGSMQDTKDILLYSINLSISVYKNGIMKLALIPKDRVDAMMRKFFLGNCSLIFKDRDCRQQIASYNTHLEYFLEAQKTYLEERLKDGPNAADAALTLVDRAETYFPGKALVEITGVENVLVQARIQGFRSNDEQGDTPLMGSTIGLAGARAVSGPLSFIQQNMQALNGEFFLSWLLNPI